MEYGGQWWSASKVMNWMWNGLFTQKTFVLITFISGVLLLQSDRPYLVFIAPIYFLPYAFLVLLFAIASMIGDGLADWAIQKIFKNPNPNNIFHMVLYLFLSSAAFPLGLIFITSGDSNNLPPALH